MIRAGLFVIAGLALAAVSGQSVHAAPLATPVDIVNLDFSKAADQAKVKLNGDAAFKNGRLELVSDVSQNGSAFITTAVPTTADYLATFQFEVQSLSGATPADGMAFVVQGAGPDKLGGGGGNIGYAGSNAFGAYSYAMELNLYPDNGLGNGKDQTIAWDAFGARTKFDQSAFPGDSPVDNGVYTAAVRVQPSQMTVTISGGKSNLAPTVAMTSTPLLPDLPIYQVLAKNPIFFGFTGATGGAGSVQDILNLRVQSPAPAP